MLLLIGQCLSLSVFPFAFVWVYLMHTRGDEMNGKDKWSDFKIWPKWFYLAPVGIGFWMLGLFLVSLAKG